MRTQIKICGLTRKQDVECALSCGADFLGFIVECESPRRLSVERAAKLSYPASGLAKRMAVTVNPLNHQLKQICSLMRPEFLQLHGQESPQRTAHIKAATGLGIVKAIAVRTQDDLQSVRSFEGIADYILLDAKPPEGRTQTGGHGRSFDWNILKGFACNTPLILAGGMNAGNITHAKTTGINFFDVSSGVEASAGVKDPSLIAEFMKVAHE